MSAAILSVLLLVGPAEAASPSPAHGEIGWSRVFGLGLVLGAPTGITGKYYLANADALEATAATWLHGPWYDGWYLHAVYLWHPSPPGRSASVAVGWHVGAGGFLTDGAAGWWDDELGWWDRDGYRGTHGGVRGVVGIDVDLARAPFQFFADVGLNTTVVPGLWLDGTLGAGARYYF